VSPADVAGPLKDRRLMSARLRTMIYAAGAALFVTVLIVVAIVWTRSSRATSSPELSKDGVDEKNNVVHAGLPEPEIIRTTDDYLDSLRKSLLGTQFRATSGVYRRNGGTTFGHDLIADGVIEVTAIDLVDGSLEKVRHAPQKEFSDRPPIEVTRANATLTFPFKSVSSGRRRFIMSAKTLSEWGIGKHIDAEQNGSKANLFFAWKDVLITGRLAIDLDYDAVGDAVRQSHLRINASVDGVTAAGQYTLDNIVPLYLSPEVVKAFSDAGFPVPSNRITGTALDASRARPPEDG
jgi:hypothetical protein